MLRLVFPMQRVQVQSLVGKLRSHTSCSSKIQSIKQKQYCNKFDKDFKNAPHQKKNPLKNRVGVLYGFLGKDMSFGENISLNFFSATSYLSKLNEIDLPIFFNYKCQGVIFSYLSMTHLKQKCQQPSSVLTRNLSHLYIT